MIVKKREDGTCFIRLKVGEGTVTPDNGEEQTMIMSVLNDYSPIIEFGDGDSVIFRWDDLARLADAAREGKGKYPELFKILEDDEGKENYE